MHLKAFYEQVRKLWNKLILAVLNIEGTMLLWCIELEEIGNPGLLEALLIGEMKWGTNFYIVAVIHSREQGQRGWGEKCDFFNLI